MQNLFSLPEMYQIFLMIDGKEDEDDQDKSDDEKVEIEDDIEEEIDEEMDEGTDSLFYPTWGSLWILHVLSCPKL